MPPPGENASICGALAKLGSRLRGNDGVSKLGNRWKYSASPFKR
jgi:hypothetical protein